jgi:hypothetical protein
MAEASLALQLLGVVWRMLGQLVAVESLVFVILRPKLLQQLHALLASGAVTLSAALHRLGLIRSELLPGEPQRAFCHHLSNNRQRGLALCPVCPVVSVYSSRRCFAVLVATFPHSCPACWPCLLAHAEEARVLLLLEEPVDGAIANYSEGSKRSTASGSLPDMCVLELPMDEGDSCELPAPLAAQAASLERLAEMHVDGTNQEAAFASAAGGSSSRQDTALLSAAREAGPAAIQPHPSSSSGGLTRPPRPAGANHDSLLRLLAEAYGQMMLSKSGRQGGTMQEEELEGWLRQLRALAVSGDGDTVLALYQTMKAQHSWVRMRDVYSALVSLRESHVLQQAAKAVAGGQGGAL